MKMVLFKTTEALKQRENAIKQAFDSGKLISALHFYLYLQSKNHYRMTRLHQVFLNINILIIKILKAAVSTLIVNLNL